MSRPKTIKDVKDRKEEIAVIYVDKLSTSPMLLKHYAALLETVQKFNGVAEVNYNSVKLFIPKDTNQLETQLRYEQSNWDNERALYDRALNRETVEDKPLREWEKDTVKRFAEQEHLPNPFDVFAANDPELDKMRQELGMS